jgi:hypothetical protein
VNVPLDLFSAGDAASPLGRRARPIAQLAHDGGRFDACHRQRCACVHSQPPPRVLSLKSSLVRPAPAHRLGPLQVWSDGRAPYPWAVEPPPELSSTVTFDKLHATASAAGVAGALIVQPVNHKYDHSYTDAALRAFPAFYKGMGLVDPSLSPEAAVAFIDDLHARGYVGVRFNAGAFAEHGGIDSPTGRAAYARCGLPTLPHPPICQTQPANPQLNSPCQVQARRPAACQPSPSPSLPRIDGTLHCSPPPPSGVSVAAISGCRWV